MELAFQPFAWSQLEVVDSLEVPNCISAPAKPGTPPAPLVILPAALGMDSTCIEARAGKASRVRALHKTAVQEHAAERAAAACQGASSGRSHDG